MGKIHLLSDDVIAKISAGEVIENPASVVKELLENSIDADASEISISIINGGKRLISIGDNGLGMDEGDANLAIERHSTSKLHDFNSIYSISTLGFRGEALSSIAAVSKMTVSTRTSDMEEAVCLKIEGGKKINSFYCSREKGTTIDVEYLFYNTPARMKFLKSPTSEYHRILDIIEKYILFYNNISFSLSNDEKIIFKTVFNDNLQDRIGTVYGSEVVQYLLPVEFEHRRCVIKGLISNTTKTFSDRKCQIFFVNGRYVKNNTLTHALELEFRNYIPKDQFPFALLKIFIEPSEIDVNVHPTKKEIKFRNDSEIYQFIRFAIRGTLEGDKFKVFIDKPAELDKKVIDSFNRIEKKLPSPVYETITFQKDKVPTERVNTISYKILGQIWNSYIVIELNQSILIVDQHAASERIIFNELNQTGELKSISQKTLFYEPVELPYKEFEILQIKKDILSFCGIEIEEFGGKSMIIKALPYSIRSIDPYRFLIDLANEIKDIEKENREDILKIVACHSAVRAGDKLEDLEIKFLLDKFFSQLYYATCPHGRPSFAKFSLDEIEKLLKRR